MNVLNALICITWFWPWWHLNNILFSAVHCKQLEYILILTLQPYGLCRWIFLSFYIDSIFSIGCHAYEIKTILLLGLVFLISRWFGFIYLYFFLLFSALPRTSRKKLNKSGEKSGSWDYSWSYWENIQFLSIMYNIRDFCRFFYQAEEVAFFFFTFCIWKGCLLLS